MAPALKAGSRPPWLGLAAAAWMMVASGTGYTFPLYSPALKSVLGYSQRQVTMLGVANDTGENFGLLAGVACNYLAPWVVLLIGAACCVLGYGVLWLAVSQTLSFQLPYWVLWIALCIAVNSATWFGTSVLVTNMRNFPLSRGTVAGILKGYGGLSAAVYTGLYAGVLHSSSAKLLLFLMLGLPAVCLAMMYFVRPCTPSLEEDSSEQGHFLFTQISSVLLGLYILAFTIIEDRSTLSEFTKSIMFAVMVLLLSAPLAVPIKMTLFPNSKKSATISHASSTDMLSSASLDIKESLLSVTSSSNLLSMHGSESPSDISMLLAEGEGAIREKKRPHRGDDFEFFQTLVKADFWLLFAAYFFGVGSGVTVLNNLAQIGTAFGVNDTTTLLCLFSFCNFLGRLGGGVVSEHFVRLRTLPRTAWMACTQTIMIISYLLYASAIDGTLYVSTAMLGICYGVQFSVTVPTVSELFGLKNFGLIFNTISLGNPLGAFLFSGLLAGYLYDQEAEKQQRGLHNSNTSCLGPDCFRSTFLVLAGVCGLGTLLCVILTVRIKPVYQMLYASGSFQHPRANALH